MECLLRSKSFDAPNFGFWAGLSRWMLANSKFWLIGSCRPQMRKSALQPSGFVSTPNSRRRPAGSRP